jgi:lipid A 4'-phosphatase
MNRTGLVLALIIAVWVGVVCAVDPQLDLDLAGLSFDPKTQVFAVNAQPWVQHTRIAARLIITLLVLPGFLAILGKLILPQRRMLIEGRAALFLVATLALGPGLITNLTFKDHWGRPRPIDVQQFGGADHFTPWWDPRGECPNNCSFIAGEPSGAFWTLAPAALAPRNCGSSPMARRSLSVPASALCASPAGRIFSATSCLPACSCIF